MIAHGTSKITLFITIGDVSVYNRKNRFAKVSDKHMTLVILRGREIVTALCGKYFFAPWK